MSIRCGCKRRLKRRQKSRLVLRYLFHPHSNSERHTYRLAFRTRSITASPTHRLMSVRRKHSRQLSPHLQHLIRTLTSFKRKFACCAFSHSGKLTQPKARLLRRSPPHASVTQTKVRPPPVLPSHGSRHRPKTFLRAALLQADFQHTFESRA